MDSAEDINRRGVLAAEYLENCRDVNASIHIIELNLIGADARKISKMFNIFRDTAVRYGLIDNQTFTDAFNDFDFDELARLVEKVTVANRILTKYIDEITTLSESETSSSDSDGS